MKLPKTLIEAVQYFSDEQACIEFVSSLRWENGSPLCPHCRSDEEFESARNENRKPVGIGFPEFDVRAKDVRTVTR